MDGWLLQAKSWADGLKRPSPSWAYQLRQPRPSPLAPLRRQASRKEVGEEATIHPLPCSLPPSPGQCIAQNNILMPLDSSLSGPPRKPRRHRVKKEIFRYAVVLGGGNEAGKDLEVARHACSRFHGHGSSGEFRVLKERQKPL